MQVSRGVRRVCESIGQDPRVADKEQPFGSPLSEIVELGGAENKARFLLIKAV
jgi:hypothetical protein